MFCVRVKHICHTDQCAQTLRGLPILLLNASNNIVLPRNCIIRKAEAHCKLVPDGGSLSETIVAPESEASICVVSCWSLQTNYTLIFIHKYFLQYHGTTRRLLAN